MDSVFEAYKCIIRRKRGCVSILVSVDSVFEEDRKGKNVDGTFGFNPSFCGFGI